MKKRGMSITTLSIMIMLMIVFFGIAINILSKSDVLSRAKVIGNSLDILQLQEMANTAYSGIYMDNLFNGIRRELTGSEIRKRMIENNCDVELINQYNIVVKGGEVYLIYRGE